MKQNPKKTTKKVITALNNSASED
jgi:hypothetical protein